MRQSEVLTRAGIGTARPGGRLKHRDRVIGAAGQRQREPDIGGIEQPLRFGEHGDGLVILALRDLHQRIFQHHLRIGRGERERVLVRRLGRGIASGGEIDVAEQGAESRVGRAILDRRFAQAQRGRQVVGDERGLRAGRNPDLRRIDRRRRATRSRQ